MASQQLPSNPTIREHAPLALAYSLMIGGMIAVFMLIRAYGETMTAAVAPVMRNGHAETNAGTVGHVLLALLIIVVLARVVGNAFRGKNEKASSSSEFAQRLALAGQAR